MGDFVRTIGDGVGGLVGGSIAAIGDAFKTIVGTLQVMLPGPLFPAAVIGVVGITAWWLFKK
ncbi:MAG TPA: hypothetical protein VM451_00640 [Candidatus Limnocylindria bacterium]|nr:hypothetical protein [Candidatus Limnocylindria bacterium]